MIFQVKSLEDEFAIYDELEKNSMISVEEVVNLLNELNSENKKLEKENLDLSEELDYYKNKCASLETGYIQEQDENWRLEKSQMEFANELGKTIDEIEQLRKENKELQGKASSWKITASEQIMEQSKLIKENAQLKQLINDKEVEWLRNNTVWEQMPTSKRTVTKTTFGDKND